MFFILGFAFTLLYISFFDPSAKHIETWTKTAVVWCILLFFKTELLSLSNHANQISFFLFWIIVCIFSLARIVFNKKLQLIKNERKALSRLFRQNKFLILFFGIMLFLSFLTVPYNWDSMTYHLPRVVNWKQNQSVAHYASNCIRQIASPPFHEFICFDLYLLSGNRDALFNMVQCISFITNAWLIYEIAKKLGCSDKYCKIGTLLFCSMPIAFGEALTTQNDHLAGVFLLTFFYYLMDFLHRGQKIKNNNITRCKVIIMSACIGFGYLTKPTVSIGMAVLAVILLIFCIIRKDAITILIRLLLISFPIIILIILPEAARNIQTFGAVFPAITGPRQLVGTLNWKYLLINGLKNFSFNLPTTYIFESTQLLTSLVLKIAAIMQVDINAPSISEDGQPFSLGTANNMGHDTAINSSIIYISIICFIWCLYRRKKAKNSQKLYTAIVVLLFAIICIFIRWEPFVSRYMLPYLALLCPMDAIWLEDASRNSNNILLRNSCTPIACWLGITGIILLSSYHIKIIHEQSPSRANGYFKNYSDIAEEYIQACEAIKTTEAEFIGLSCGENDYEYPIYYMLKHKAKRIEHIMVNNDTQKYENTAYVPDCILALNNLGETVEYHGISYEKWIDGNINVYRAAP